MTAPRLDLGELRRLHEAATPGPWIGRTGTETTDVSCEETVPVVAWLGFDDGDRKRRAHNMNAALIAAARNALPALLSIAEAAEALDKQRLANSLSTPESSYLMEIKLGLALRAALAAVTEE